MDRLDINTLRRRIQSALAEDIGSGDVTTGSVVTSSPHTYAEIVARQDGVVAGIQVASMVFEELESGLGISPYCEDGDEVSSGDRVLALEGDGGAILSGERLALNLLGRMSGITTLTRQYVQAIAGTGAQILDTRKTTPLWRDLEKYAVRLGGGANHRMGLYDMILIKENHIRWAGGIGNAVKHAFAYVQSHDPDIEVEVEVRSLEELEEALKLGVSRVLLDNMTPGIVAEAVELTEGEATLEVSGGIDLHSVRSYGETGVDYISVGSLTHSAPVLDLSLLFRDQDSASTNDIITTGG